MPLIDTDNVMRGVRLTIKQRYMIAITLTITWLIGLSIEPSVNLIPCITGALTLFFSAIMARNHNKR